ncbi:MAG: hypothetical protein ACMVO3_01250 [Thalassobaculum sp.]
MSTILETFGKTVGVVLLVLLQIAAVAIGAIGLEEWGVSPWLSVPAIFIVGFLPLGPFVQLAAVITGAIALL